MTSAHLPPPAPAPAQAGNTSDGADRIRQAAIELFRQRGYHGTSVRELAQAVGIEPASLYYHFASKQDILVDLFDRIMDDLIAGFEQSVQGISGAAPRLQAALRFHLNFHVERQAEALVSHSELRALTPDNLRRIVAKRDRYEVMMRGLLADGVAEGCFEIDDVGLLTIGLLMMCSGVSDWYGPGGRLSGESVTDGYVDMVFRMVGAQVPQHSE